MQAGGLKKFDGRIVEAMVKEFSNRLSYALQNNDSALMVNIYIEANARPHTYTKEELQLRYGFKVNGPFEGRPKLQYVYLGKKPMLLKTLDDSEKLSYRTLASHINVVSPSNYMCPFELHQDKYAIMPRYNSTLETIDSLTPEEGLEVFNQMVKAIKVLHSLGMAHMDVKSSNIFIDMEGNSYLGDFGSVALYGVKTRSTEPFIPSDMRIERKLAGVYVSHHKFDYWMLAMVVVEKVFHDIVVVGKEVDRSKIDEYGHPIEQIKEPTTNKIIELLSAVPVLDPIVRTLRTIPAFSTDDFSSSSSSSSIFSQHAFATRRITSPSSTITSPHIHRRAGAGLAFDVDFSSSSRLGSTVRNLSSTFSSLGASGDILQRSHASSIGGSNTSSPSSHGLGQTR